MGLASSAGAFPLVMIDDSVRCAAPECSHANHLALVERVRLRCLAAREISVVSSDLTTRISIRTFEMPRFSDVSLETHPLSQTRHGSGRRIYPYRLAGQEKPFDNVFLNNPPEFRGKTCGELDSLRRFLLRESEPMGGFPVTDSVNGGVSMRTLVASTILAPLLGASLAWSQNVPTRRFSTPQVEYAEPFSDIGSVRELRDGRVIVVDARELTVKLIDFRARTETTIGRSGEGPGEYRWPTRLFALPGDSTLLQDAATDRLMIIQPDGKTGAFFDPNRTESDSGLARMRRFNVRASDGRRYLYGEAQPIRIGANGVAELADHAPIERLDMSTRKRDTVAMRPLRKDANARLIPGAGVATQPGRQPWPAFEQWVVSPAGRIAFVFPDPYRVDFVAEDGRVTENTPIAYERVRVDDALKKQYRAERQRPRMALVFGRSGSASSMQMIPGRYSEPAEWPQFLPPYSGSAVFAPDGLLWIPRLTAAGRPPLYDIVNANGRLVERVQLPARTKLVGFGAKSVYVVRMDDDDLQYLQRYPIPTTDRP
jgi:hypothetical protein